MALAAGATALALQPNVVPAGSFISVNSFGPQAVAFGSLQVPVAAVPEPASAGLLLAGVLGLGWALRRRGAAATSAAGACR
jgi:hypothetical protein